MANIQLLVYGRPECIPCNALKQHLAEKQLSYTYIDVRDLRESNAAEFERVRNCILNVSTHETPTVPAVAIIENDTEYWISNHGQMDLKPMQEEIHAKLEALGHAPID